MSTPLRERPDAPLGTLIFRAGLLPAETIESALEEGVKSGKRLGEILTERGLIKEVDLARLLAGQKGLEYVTLREQIVDPAAAALFAPDQARLFRALPYAFEDGIPVVAIADPTDDVLLRNIREALAREDVKFVVATRGELVEIGTDVYSKPLAPTPAPEPEPAPEATLPAEAPEPAPEPHVEAEAEVGWPTSPPEPPVEPASAPGHTVQPAEPALNGHAEHTNGLRSPDLIAPPVPAQPAEPAPEPAPSLEPVPQAEAALEAAPAPVVETPVPEQPVAPEPVAAPAPAPISEPPVSVPETPAPAPVQPPAPAPAVPEAPQAALANELTVVPELAPTPSAPEHPAVPEPTAAPEPVPMPMPVPAPPPPAPHPPAAEEPLPELQAALDLVAAAPAPEAEAEAAREVAPEPEVEVEAETEPEPTGDEAEWQVALRLSNGERVDAGTFADEAAAKQQARTIMSQVGDGDQDEWPYVNGRFLKPDTIVSVDIAEISGDDPS